MRLIVRSSNELQPIEINDVPVMTVNAEIEVLFPMNCVHQYCSPVSAHFDGAFPQRIPDTSRNVPDEDTWTDLQ